MDKARTKSALKLLKDNNQALPRSTTTTNKGMAKEELKEKTYDKTKATPKPSFSSAKENTKPQEFKLHTGQRAVQRAMFNYYVATKLYFEEQEKKQARKVEKLIEEEEVRLLRKEMIPRAQLMPFFNRPFFPQRSNRPLTIPREPSFHNVNSKCWSCITEGEFYHYQHAHHAWRPQF